MSVLIGISAVLGIVLIIINLVTNVSKRSARRRVGDGRGMTLAQVVAILGKPQAKSINDAGDTVYQWMQANQLGGYHYVYVFRDGVCLGLAHESRSGI
jgi:hypothetical protein